jgi:hypothetical protein
MQWSGYIIGKYYLLYLKFKYNWVPILYLTMLHLYHKQNNSESLGLWPEYYCF